MLEREYVITGKKGDQIRSERIHLRAQLKYLVKFVTSLFL